MKTIKEHVDELNQLFKSYPTNIDNNIITKKRNALELRLWNDINFTTNLEYIKQIREVEKTGGWSQISWLVQNEEIPFMSCWDPVKFYGKIISNWKTRLPEKAQELVDKLKENKDNKQTLELMDAYVNFEKKITKNTWSYSIHEIFRENKIFRDHDDPLYKKMLNTIKNKIKGKPQLKF